jgi:hypothetical protein
MPIGWKPTLPRNERPPQAIINKQLLKSSDLLVAVFWTRLGSPTGVADSGTVEEINEHLAGGKPAMIYFSVVRYVWTAPMLSSIKTAFLQEDLRQRGLIYQYGDLTTFRMRILRHLAQKVIVDFVKSPEGASTRPVPESLSDLIKDTATYFLNLREAHQAKVFSRCRVGARPICTKDASDLLLEAVQDPSVL